MCDKKDHHRTAERLTPPAGAGLAPLLLHILSATSLTNTEGDILDTTICVPVPVERSGYYQGRANCFVCLPPRAVFPPPVPKNLSNPNRPLDLGLALSDSEVHTSCRQDRVGNNPYQQNATAYRLSATPQSRHDTTQHETCLQMTFTNGPPTPISAPPPHA